MTAGARTCGAGFVTAGARTCGAGFSAAGARTCVAGFAKRVMRHRVHANYASFEDTTGNHNLLLDPYNSTVIDYLQSDGTGHSLGVHTV